MNKHIENYLDLYLEREDVEYATLLTGKWGCGKTYFIKNYIEKKSEEKKYKFIYISLFGLKDIPSVNDAIFEELHPILSHKGVKILGGVLKSAIKLGFKFDLGGDKNDETSVNIDFTKLNPFDKTEYKDLIFIFDDLERTLISTTEILGFINSICDSEKMKTIIIANEDEINDNKETYKRFKEKVIGKSFTIHNDNKSYWQSFEKKYSSQLKKYEIIISIIQSTFERFGNKNYRNLIQTTDDYIDFTKKIKSDYLDNDEFIESLSEQFYTLSLEYKKTHDIDSVLESLKQDNSGFYYSLIFDEDIWKMIITSHYSSYSELNEFISSLSIFNIKEEESWQRLWHYREKDKSEFYSNLKDVKNKFTSIEYENIGILMHAVSMLVFFVKKNLCRNISIDEIEQTLSKYLDKYKETSLFPDFRFLKFNYTGLGYINEEDEDFIRIRSEFYKNLDELKLILETNKIIEDFYELLEFIKVGDWSNWYSVIYEKNKYNFFLTKEHVNQVMKVLINDSNNFTGLYNFCYFLDERYKTNHIIDGITLAEHFKSEESFIDECIAYLTNKYDLIELDPFDKFKLNEILNMLKLKKERFKK
ncbi:P-loop NTPase fold protein [Aggregatibacter kilianii]|jgi:hypothetical protein|uniref:P-loop NTPase fold protein n=1 Tax=Aggregatibacter kilianii TaxID=2025884 RepID=UPI000D64CF82|nr:P-loop NTPase fold protein [Aggregatibacter kilianii]